MSELDTLIASLRRIGNAKEVGELVAKRAEGTLHAAVSKTLAAGQSPEGEPWAPRKAGGRAYANAASKLTAKAYGNLVRLTIKGPEAYGHFGSRGMPVRQMLPDAGAELPPSVDTALRQAAREVFEGLING